MGSDVVTFMELKIAPAKIAEFVEYLKNSGDETLIGIAKEIEKRGLDKPKGEEQPLIKIEIGYGPDGKISNRSRLVP